MLRKDQDEFSAGRISLLPLIILLITISDSIKAYSAISPIAAVILLFSGVTCTFFVYNTEAINQKDRKKLNIKE